MSRIGNPQPPPTWGRPADCQSAKQQVGNLRYEAEVHGKGWGEVIPRSADEIRVVRVNRVRHRREVYR